MWSSQGQLFHHTSAGLLMPTRRAKRRPIRETSVGCEIAVEIISDDLVGWGNVPAPQRPIMRLGVPGVATRGPCGRDRVGKLNCAAAAQPWLQCGQFCPPSGE